MRKKTFLANPVKKKRESFQKYGGSFSTTRKHKLTVHSEDGSTEGAMHQQA